MEVRYSDSKQGPNAVGLLNAGTIDRLCEACKPGSNTTPDCLEILVGFAASNRMIPEHQPQVYCVWRSQRN